MYMAISFSSRRHSRVVASAAASAAKAARRVSIAALSLVPARPASARSPRSCAWWFPRAAGPWCASSRTSSRGSCSPGPPSSPASPGASGPAAASRLARGRARQQTLLLAQLRFKRRARSSNASSCATSVARGEVAHHRASSPRTRPPEPRGAPPRATRPPRASSSSASLARSDATVAWTPGAARRASRSRRPPPRAWSRARPSAQCARPRAPPRPSGTAPAVWRGARRRARAPPSPSAPADADRGRFRRTHPPRARRPPRPSSAASRATVDDSRRGRAPGCHRGVGRGKRPCASSSGKARRCRRPDLDSGSRLPARIRLRVERRRSRRYISVSHHCFAREGTSLTRGGAPGTMPPRSREPWSNNFTLSPGPSRAAARSETPSTARDRDDLARALKERIAADLEIRPRHEPAPARASSRNALRERARDPRGAEITHWKRPATSARATGVTRRRLRTGTPPPTCTGIEAPRRLGPARRGSRRARNRRPLLGHRATPLGHDFNAGVASGARHDMPSAAHRERAQNLESQEGSRERAARLRSKRLAPQRRGSPRSSARCASRAETRSTTHRRSRSTDSGPRSQPKTETVRY